MDDIHNSMNWLVRRRVKTTTTFPNAPTEDDELEEYKEILLNIGRKRDEITSFSQTLNYLLVHSTKPGSEAHSMIKRIMRQSNGFEAWRQLTMHFTGRHHAQQFSLLRAIMSPS
eukprot:1776752-Amphidinium_carterae.2